MGRISILLASLMVVVSTVSSTATAFDYKGALEMSLLFFEAQRSGKLPPDHRVKWRGDSALTDGFKQGVDLVGGYCDAGDHVKFVFPMAFAVTMLSWGVIEFEKEMIAASQLKQALGAIQWGTDYFLKGHKAPNTLWVQVGDGDCRSPLLGEGGGHDDVKDGVQGRHQRPRLGGSRRDCCCISCSF